MAQKKETIVGFVGLITFVSLLIFFNYLKTSNKITRDIIVTAKFRSVTGLLNTQPVKANGVEVGKVVNIYKEDGDPNNKITSVDLRLYAGTKIPKDAIAYCYNSTAPIGIFPVEVTLEFDMPCEEGSGNCLETGDVIQGRGSAITDFISESGLATIDPYLSKLSDIDSVYAMLDDLTAQTAAANASLARLNPTIRGAVRSSQELSQGFRDSTPTILTSLVSLNTTLEKMNTQQLPSALGATDSMFIQLNNMLDTADVRLLSTDEMIEKTNDAIDKLQVNPMFVMLTENEAFADSIKMKVGDFHDLIRDMRLNPKNYLRLDTDKPIKPIK